MPLAYLLKADNIRKEFTESSAELNLEELNDCDGNHEINVVEVNETKLDVPLRAHASFTLNENNEGVLMKEDEVIDDVTKIFNN